MLTIENKIKIVNHQITAEWYVEDISELVYWDVKSMNAKPYYCIKIRNRDNRYFEEINLYRVRNGVHGHWYELNSIRQGKTHAEYINIRELKYIKNLLVLIKKVGID